MAIIVKSQKELDMIPLDAEDIIRIEFGTSESPAIVRNRYKHHAAVHNNRSVVVLGNSVVITFDNSHVEAYGNSHVRARGNSSVVAFDNCSVEANDNSVVVAFDNCSVEAHDDSVVEAHNDSSVVVYGNSSVVAFDNCFVEAWGNSYVDAHDNSFVRTQGNSVVVAYGESYIIANAHSTISAYGESYIIANTHSTVSAYENSYVVAYTESSINAFGNAQVLDCQNGASINLFENARSIFVSKNTKDFMRFYNIKHDETTAIFYKAVHKAAIDGCYASDFDRAFIYEIGKKAFSTAFDCDPVHGCGEGIHFGNMSRALNYGRDWIDLAILEVRVKIKDILVPIHTDGKVRAPEVEVIREVPLEECGTLGKIILRRRENMKGNDDD